jgi:glycosyltransferase involved in cell wall biosynthesis
VLTIHDVAAFADPASAGEEERRRLRRSAARAHRIITVSEFSRREIAHHLQIPAERVEVVLEGVEPEFRPQTIRSRADFLKEHTGGRPFAFFVGNGEPRKGLGLLLEAFQAIRDRVPHALVLSGSPPRPRGLFSRWLAPWSQPDSPILERCLQTLQDRVLWAGAIDDETLRDYYRHCDLFVCPSLYEGFGLPLLEAMACGAPVAAARRASLPEVGGEVPLWFDPEDHEDFARALVEGLEHSPDRRGRGVERARLFRWDDAALSILQILESCRRVQPD